MSNKSMLSEAALKTIAFIKENVKQMVNTRKKGITYKELPKDSDLDINVVKKAADLKTEIEILKAKLSALDEQYNPLRKEILEKLPGQDIDKVTLLIDGIQIKKSVQVRDSGKLDYNKIFQLARQKKIITKISKNVKIFDEELILLAIDEGHITYEEYLECLTEGNIIPTLKLEKKFVPEVVDTPEESLEAI